MYDEFNVFGPLAQSVE